MNCPNCNSEMKDGFLNASGMGIVWLTKPDKFFLVGKNTERLQKDWWGFPKLKKISMPASRCQACKMVVFQYSNDT